MSRTLLTCVLAACTLAACTLADLAIASAEPCSDADLRRILAPATEESGRAVVDCDLELTPLLSAAISRRLVFRGSASSGTTLDCNGGMLGRPEAPMNVLVESRPIGSSSIPGIGLWEPVTDVTIRDCEIHGSVRIRGMGPGHWDDDVTRSSHVPFGHVARVREGAPRRITLEGVTLVGHGMIPLFVSPGVQDTSLLRSYVTGSSRSVAIYLDAESRGTTVRDCTIDTETPRELIAIDGSEENRILGNWLSNLENGGIYLFRNCGERTFVRSTPAQHNEIIDNVFYYDRYTGPNPAIFFGSDGGFATHRFCHDDLEFPFGSGADDRDFTSRNAVMQNQIYRRSVDAMIHTEWLDSNRPNYVAHNTTVTSAVSRPAGCFTRADHDPSFLPHGASTTLAWDRDGRPYEDAVEVTCDDGDLAYASTPRLRATREVPFACSVSGDDRGCRGEVRCAEGETLAGAHAACNLEFGPVSDAALASVPRDTLRVPRWSDVPLEGRCWVGDRGAGAGELSLAGWVRGSSAAFGCRERDRNGGDCEIRGVAYCARAAEAAPERAGARGVE